MSDFQQYVSYGAPGLILFVIVKWVFPVFDSIAKKASVESKVYDIAKDQLTQMQKRYDRLEQLYEAEKRERKRLERELREALKD